MKFKWGGGGWGGLFVIEDDGYMPQDSVDLGRVDCSPQNKTFFFLLSSPLFFHYATMYNTYLTVLNHKKAPEKKNLYIFYAVD